MTRPNIEELDRLWEEATADENADLQLDPIFGVLHVREDVGLNYQMAEWLYAVHNAYPELSAYVKRLEQLERAIVAVYEHDKGIAYGDLDRILRAQQGGVPLSYEQGRIDEQYATGPDQQLLELMRRCAVLEDENVRLRSKCKTPNKP